jgi:hypothetical protein
LRIGIKLVRERPIGSKRDNFTDRSLNFRKRTVQNVRRIRQPEQLATSDKRSGQNCQQIVAAVAAQHGTGINLEFLGDGFPNQGCHGIGIPGQSGLRNLLNCRKDFFGCPIGILVGVEFNGFTCSRLLTGNIATHSYNFWSNKIHHGSIIQELGVRSEE